jgi:Rrf2 family iron-sulfur cluster assembly transcriptional regulator
MFAALRCKQLVRGVRGPGGGYYLAKPSNEISIADILCAVDEWVELTHRNGRENGRDGKRFLTHALWDQLSAEILGLLCDISLADLVSRGYSADEVDIDSNGVELLERKRAA